MRNNPRHHRGDTPDRRDTAAPSWPLPKAEPAMVRAITVALALLASLGFSWAADVDPDTIVLLALVLPPLAAVAQGLWTRYAVTANAKVVARVTTQGQVVAGDAAVIPTGTELGARQTATGTRLEPVAVKPELATDTVAH